MYGRYKEEHAFRIFQKDLKDSALPGVLLLCGKEQFLVEWAKNQIISKYIDPVSKVLDLTIIDEDGTNEMSQSGSSSPANYIMENAETLPLISAKKVVIVRDSKLLQSSEKAEGKNSDLSKLCEYLSNLPGSTLLVFTASSVDKKKKLPKSISKYGKVYDFDQLDRRELLSFADKRFKAAGISVPGRTMEYLVDETGYFNKESDYDLFTFSNDITKLIALSENGTITEKDIKDTVEKDLETFIFSLMNCISEGKKEKAFELLHNIVSDRTDVSGLVAMIVSQFETMYSVKELMEDRVPDRLILEKTGINEYRLKMLKPFISKYTAKKLRSDLELAYEIDRNIKTGLLKPILALELFIARI